MSFRLKDLFRAALVVHVDLSVAVWFMAFAAVIWCAVGGSGLAWLGLEWRRPGGAGDGADERFPVLPGAEPVLNNYIPVLRQPLFFASLWIFAAGASLTVLRALITTWPRRFSGRATAARRFSGRRRRVSVTRRLLLVLGDGAVDRGKRSITKCCSGAADTRCSFSMRC
jgi:cytochrome c oxidase subunit 1